ncbi:MAG: PAQR family membrane homeostasis protein TrhA [Actinomycetota bacterium]
MAPVKPRFRGVLHEIAFFVSLVTGPILILISRAGSHLGTAVYSLAMSGLFGFSALYHRPNWPPKVRRWLARVDHTMITVFTAATFTPIVIAIDTPWSRTVLLISWGGALLAMCIQFLPVKVPKPVAVIPYLALGWLGITLFPESWSHLGAAPPVLLFVGGALYTIGALVYARRKPDPKPAVFGYHEIFHALVVAAAYFHYGAVASAVA